MSRIKCNFFLLFLRYFGILTNGIETVAKRGKTPVKTKTWIILFAAAAAVCLFLSLPLFSREKAAFARITSGGDVVRTVDLSIDQEFTVDGHNTVTVRDGAIAVTWADCPDHYCMKRGFCAGGTDIVCLPNRLVIEFMGEQEVDAAVG